MVRHVVMWKFKPGTEREQRDFLAALRALAPQVEGLLSQEIGRNVGPESNYDAAAVATFATAADVERYRQMPQHLAVSAQCRAIRVARTAVDFEVG